MYVSAVLQAAALDVVTQQGWQTPLCGVRQQFKWRRDLLIYSTAEYAPLAHPTAIPQGELNLWYRLPEMTSLATLIRGCEDENVCIAPGSGWFPAEPTGLFIRLNYSGPSTGAFTDGANIVGRVPDRSM